MMPQAQVRGCPQARGLGRLRRRAAAMLFWALLASGQITMRKVDGLAEPRSAAVHEYD